MDLPRASLPKPITNAQAPLADLGRRLVAFSAETINYLKSLRAELDNGSAYVLDDDARLSDARTPTAHASSHLPGSSDELTTAAAGAITPGDTASAGSAASLARSDHRHAISGFGTTAGTFCQGNDARLSDSRAPTGAAGGALAGTYPNPTLAVGAPASGTYTPTLTAVTNVAATSVIGTFKYLRVGNVVTVAGRINVDPTAAASAQTVVGISLPIASAMTTSADAAGTGVCFYPTAQMGQVFADATNDRAQLEFAALSASDNPWSLHFTYEVK